MTTPYPAPSPYSSVLGDTIVAGSWLSLASWPFRPYMEDTEQLGDCYVWRVEQEPDGALVLVAHGIDRRLPLTEDRSKCVTVIQPAVTQLSDYPREWARWMESGFGIYLVDGPKGLELISQKGGQTWGGILPIEMMDLRYDSDEVSYFLMETLYLHMHKTKGARLWQEHGHVPDEEVWQFIRQMERREAKGLSSLPTRAGSKAGA